MNNEQQGNSNQEEAKLERHQKRSYQEPIYVCLLR